MPPPRPPPPEPQPVPAPGRAVSVRDVASLAGVSIATVSRVMNGISARASGPTAERVFAAVRSLGYRPMGAGQALRQRQSRLVAVLAANVANPAMAAIAEATETALRREGLVMVLCDTHDRADLQDEYLLEMRAQMARATVLLAAVASPQLEAMQRASEPLLFVNRRSPHAGPHAFIGIDNRAAGREIAAFMLAHGVPAPALIHGALTSSATAERIAGFREALGQAGAPAPCSAGDEALAHVEIGHRHALAALPGPGGRQGIFCTSDLIAYGAHRRLTDAGLRIPQDILLVGFDDNPLNDWLATWLSSVRVPYAEIGQAVVGTLQHLRSGTMPRVILPHRMIDRSAAPSAPSQNP